MTKPTATKRGSRASTSNRRVPKTKDPVDPRSRLTLLFASFVLVGAVLVAVLIDIQAVRNDELRGYGQQQRSRTLQLDGYRGQVVDRNGYVLAASTPSGNIVADPTRVADPSETASALAPLLNQPATEIEAALRPADPDSRYVQLERNADEETLEAVNGQNDAEPLTGVYVEVEEHRIYPTADVASQIVGRVDPDEVGISGIEAQYDEVLTGSPGQEVFEGAQYGRISVGETEHDPATEGFDVILTLDHRLQFMAEQTLIAHCEETGAKRATALVSQPSTGEILVMASIDRNDDDECEVAGYNTALIDAFEPGSVVKPFTVAGAVQDFGYDRNTEIEVPPSIQVANKTFVDQPAHPAAAFPLSQVLGNSMNVGTIKLAQELGNDRVYHYLNGFGLGSSTGLGFQGESVGIVRTPDEWQGSDAGSMPIGQGLTVNSTQLLAAYNVFANDGVYQQPLLISALRNPDGEYYSPDERPKQTVVSPEAVDEVRAMLTGVVTDGTGQQAAIPGYTVAGKTGTAWKVFDNGSGAASYGQPGDRRYVVTFAGMVPAENPEISMVVVVDEPNDVVEATAGTVAAPIFSEIGRDVLRVLNVAPNDSTVVNSDGLARSEPAQLPTPTPLPEPVVEVVPVPVADDEERDEPQENIPGEPEDADDVNERSTTLTATDQSPDPLEDIKESGP